MTFRDRTLEDTINDLFMVADRLDLKADYSATVIVASLLLLTAELRDLHKELDSIILKANEEGGGA